MPGFDQRGQSVNNQFNAGGNIHIYADLTDYVPTEFQDFEQLNKILNSLETETLSIANKTVIFNNSMVALTETANQQSFEQIRPQAEYVLGQFGKEIVMYSLFLNRISREYKASLIYTENGLRRFLKLQPFQVLLHQDQIIKFISSISDVEKKAFMLTAVLGRLNLTLQGLIMPQKLFQSLNEAVEVTISEVSQFTNLVNETIQMVWRTRGIAEGLLRSSQWQTT